MHKLSRSTFAEAWEELGTFGSYQRTEAMVHVMIRAPTPAERVAVFLDWGNMCDAPWVWRSIIADMLRRSCAAITLADLLPLDARTLYDALPDLFPVYRGCERGRERGLHWTVDRAVAEGFASGRRCINPHPTLVQALIPRRHVLSVFACRKENEIVVDPRRLRKLSIQSL